MPAIPLAAQIDEVSREVSLREALHPGKIASGQISRTVSELQRGRMDAALKTLRFVKANREKIEAAVGALP